MSLYIVDLWVDGYESDDKREEAEMEFIDKSLDKTFSSLHFIKCPKEKENELLELIYQK